MLCDIIILIKILVNIGYNLGRRYLQKMGTNGISMSIIRMRMHHIFYANLQT